MTGVKIMFLYAKIPKTTTVIDCYFAEKDTLRSRCQALLQADI